MNYLWIDKRDKRIMNLCINYELGISFLKSINAFKISHMPKCIFKIVDECIKEVVDKSMI